MLQCPTHQSEMRQSSKGGWFCPKKNPDGSYCSHKLSAAPQAPAASPVAASSNGPGADYLLAAEALKFAATLYGVTPVELHEDAVTFAVKAFRSMKAVMS